MWKSQRWPRYILFVHIGYNAQHSIGCELMNEHMYFFFSATICNGEMDCWDIWQTDCRLHCKLWGNWNSQKKHKMCTRHARNITYLCKHAQALASLYTDIYFKNGRICSRVNVDVSPLYWTKPESLFPLHFTWIVWFKPLNQQLVQPHQVKYGLFSIYLSRHVKYAVGH